MNDRGGSGIPAAEWGSQVQGSRAARAVCCFLVGLTMLVAALSEAVGQARNLNALALLDPNASFLRDRGQGLEVRLAVSQAVPYRVSFLADPPRLVVDFREVDFGAVRPAALVRSDRVVALSWGPFLAGWSRMVALLDRPLGLASAEESTGADKGAVIRLDLKPMAPADFATVVARDAALAGDWTLPKPAAQGMPQIHRQTGDRPLVVVLDPGHGGIDPGAEQGKSSEAATVLTFALELAEVLRRAGMRVELTREKDVFVPLETRISRARATRADVFLSLHADALAEGEATGATIYKLAAKASDSASQQLAERHDRADILAGVDLSGNDDEVASVLLDLARKETEPRANRLADALRAAIQGAGIKMHRFPVQEAAFSVLKSADIPSLLIEVGFLSSPDDRDRLADPVWRKGLETAILGGLDAWAIPDAAEARLLRQ